MEFGVMLPQLRMPFAVIERRVRAAEEAGFHSVWFMDHLAAPAAPDVDTLEAWTVATAIAARTERIRIGHLVLCTELRHPAVLAKMAATLDHVSDGRLELGLGWGSVPDELTRYGLPNERNGVRAARMAETLDILALMFAGEPFDHDGPSWTMRGAIGRPRPVQHAVPITIGGSGPTFTLPLVNRYAHWWNVPCYAVDQLADLRPRVEPHVSVSVQRPIGLARSAAERDEVASTAARRFGSWGGLSSGTADEVAAALASDAALGATRWIIQFSDFGEPETLAHFMAEVAPAVG